jgi:hypothetical protein
MASRHVTRGFHGFAIAAWVASLAGCGGGGEPGSAATPPARSGQVWEVQGSDDRTAVPGSIVAFVNGVHVMVVDGDRIFAGMTELTTKSGSGGTRTITFPSGLSADLVPAAQGGELRFSTGERVAVRARQGE